MFLTMAFLTFAEILTMLYFLKNHTDYQYDIRVEERATIKIVIICLVSVKLSFTHSLTGAAAAYCGDRFTMYVYALQYRKYDW